MISSSGGSSSGSGGITGSSSSSSGSSGTIGSSGSVGVRPGGGSCSPVSDGVPDIAIAEIDDRGYVVSVRTSDRNARYTSMPKITFIGGGGGAGAKFLPNMSCLDNIGLETQGYAKIGTGKYIDCP